MCGITGIFQSNGRRTINFDTLGRMTERLTHRGPDDHGVHAEPGIGLGFRRLSIIDLAGGHQPMFNEDGQVAVIFNGEIYNFRELRVELERAGHRFATSSDTEVLVHGWEVWGKGLVQRLRGMFAFAVWDRARRTLFLARDRLGIKPLYYAELPGGCWIFASELKALLEDPDLPRKLDPRAVEEYFTLGYVPDPHTILQGVAKLPPAHTLTLGETSGRAEPESYWDITMWGKAPISDSGGVEELLLDRLDESVRSHLVADVPLGAFLSGGIDSSAVVSSMVGVEGAAVRTCSIAFGEDDFDESRFARGIAQQFQTDHREEVADSQSFHLLDDLVEAYDEPFCDSSVLPTYLLCRLARRHVKVALSGDGGDETLAGYHRYRNFLTAVRLHRALPGPLRAPILGLAGVLARAPGLSAKMARRAKALGQFGGSLPESYLWLVGISDPQERRVLYSDAFRRELQGYQSLELLQHHYANAPTDDPLSRVQYVDLKTYLPGDILTKVDRASMAHSLEVRVPLLDHQWVEWTASLPPGLKLKDGVGKHVFRRALRSRLSEDVLWRRKKGFSAPVSAWLRGPLREAMRSRLLGPGPGRTDILSPEGVQRLVHDHLAGRADHGSILWALLMFQASWERLVGA
jgi:asparagine synthase (glutamine-hydrolysing)